MLEPTTDIFKLTLAQPVLTDAGEHPALIEVSWVLNELTEHAIQIYVDGKLHDAVLHTGPRRCWIACDRRRPHFIALLGVDAAHAFNEQPQHLDTFEPAFDSHWSLSMLRDTSLSVDAVVEVDRNGERVHERLLWESDVHRDGFGALFGVGGFGSDAATGPGIGLGSLGHGPLGSDAQPFFVEVPYENDAPQTWGVALRASNGDSLTAVTQEAITPDLPPATLTTLTTSTTDWLW